MSVKYLQNKNQWNEFVMKNHGSFLQSYEWANFQYHFGREVDFLAVENAGEIIAGTSIIKYDLPANRHYFFSPYGPVVSHADILDEIQKIAAKKKVIFWRYEQKQEIDEHKVKAVHPEHTLLLDILTKGEEKLLSEMKSKTRYNIHLAEKKGVKIKISNDIKDLDFFYDLVQKTAERQKVNFHSKLYYQTMFHELIDSQMLKLYLAEYQNKIIAANLIVNFNDTVTYLHGGTDNDYRDVMAPHLLQWRAICDAMYAGYKYYDFFGIAPSDDPHHPWAGITRFKKGFGGYEKIFSGTYEYALNNLWYRAYRLIKKIK